MWEYTGQLEMLVGGRGAVEPTEEMLHNFALLGTPISWGEGIRNPLLGRVTVRKVLSGQAASDCMYRRKQLLLNPNHAFSSKVDWEKTEHPVIVKSLTNGKFKARIMSPYTAKVEYFVDGIPANGEQLRIIAAYKKERTANPLQVKVQFPYLDNLQNVIQDLPEIPD